MRECYGTDTRCVSHNAVITGCEEPMGVALNQQIFDHTIDLILVVDRQGNLVRVSPSSEEILGRTPEEMIKASAADYVHPEDLEKTRAMMRHQRRSGNLTRHFECRYIHKDGHPVLLTWTGVWVEQDQLHFFIGRDITEARALEQLDHLADELGKLQQELSGYRVAARLIRIVNLYFVEASLILASIWACWVLSHEPSNFSTSNSTFFLAEKLNTHEAEWAAFAGIAAGMKVVGLLWHFLVGDRLRIAFTLRCIGLGMSGAFWLLMGASTMYGNPDTLFGFTGLLQGLVALAAIVKLASM
jgi:PAS domain S-box-containing protein